MVGADTGADGSDGFEPLSLIDGFSLGVVVWISLFGISMLRNVLVGHLFGGDLGFNLSLFLRANVAGLLVDASNGGVGFILNMALLQIGGAIVGGYVFVGRKSHSGFAAGASIVSGFATMSILAFLFLMLDGDLDSIVPDSSVGGGLVFLFSIFFVGAVVQPAVFGGIGGVLGDST